MLKNKIRALQVLVLLFAVTFVAVNIASVQKKKSATKSNNSAVNPTLVFTQSTYKVYDKIYNDNPLTADEFYIPLQVAAQGDDYRFNYSAVGVNLLKPWRNSLWRYTLNQYGGRPYWCVDLPVCYNGQRFSTMTNNT